MAIFHTRRRHLLAAFTGKNRFFFFIKTSGVIWCKLFSSTVQTKEGCLEVSDARLVSSHTTMHLPAHSHRPGRAHSPSTPEPELCGGLAAVSGLSTSACCVRCRWRPLSDPSPDAVAPPPPAAAATEAAAPCVPPSGMLSIREERRLLRGLSWRSSGAVASQGEGRAWERRGGGESGAKSVKVT